MKIRPNGGAADRDGADGVEPGPARAESTRPLARSALVFAAVLVLVLATAGIWFLGDFFRPAPEIPTPANLGQLEPQLRAYISEKVQWVRESPRDTRRHATLGMVYAANSLWQEAKAAFENAARLNPKEPLAAMFMGVASLELGDLDDAALRFRKLTEGFPEFAPGFYRLGDTLLRLGDAPGAEIAFRRLVELAPKEWRGYSGVGDARLRQNDPAQASEWLKKAIELDPSSRIAHHLLGLAYRGLGRKEDAEVELLLGRNAQMFPMPDAWSETASEHMKLIQDQIDAANQAALAGQPDKAVEVLVKALSFSPTNLTLMNNLAIAYNRSRQPEKAHPLLSMVLEKHRQFLPAYITMSFTSQLLGRNDDALTYADRAVALDPNTAQAHLARANALLAAERDTEAVNALQDALRCDPQNAEISVELGDVHWRNLNLVNQAREYFQRAVQLDPGFVGAHARLAELALQRGDAADAEAAIAMIRKLAPAEPGLPVLERRLKKITPK